MDKEIIEGNKAISEFMGIWGNRKGIDVTEPQGLKYHTSWDWLMPVVEKIESIHDEHHGYFGVHISSNGCTIQATNFRPDKPIPNPPHYFADYVYDTKILSTWMAVVGFIKWYNNENTSIK